MRVYVKVFELIFIIFSVIALVYAVFRLCSAGSRMLLPRRMTYRVDIRSDGDRLLLPDGEGVDAGAVSTKWFWRKVDRG